MSDMKIKVNLGPMTCECKVNFNPNEWMKRRKDRWIRNFKCDPSFPPIPHVVNQILVIENP